MYAQVISSVLHLLLCIFCVTKFDMGVSGLGIATLITYFAMFLITLTYGFCVSQLRKVFVWPSRDCLRGWGEYLAISLPATVMLLAEGWAFNVLGVLSGLISVTDQAVNTILLMIIAIMFMVPMGIQSAACAIIGEQIGANRVSVAKAYFKVMSWATLFLLFIIQITFYTFKHQIVAVFTTDPAVDELANKCFFIIMLAFLPDCIQGSIQGVIRALDVQKQASYLAIAAFYLCSIPMACILVFKVGMGVEGLWIGMACGILLQGIFYTTLVLRTDWQEVAYEAVARIEREEADRIKQNEGQDDLISQDSRGSQHSRQVSQRSHRSSNHALNLSSQGSFVRA